VNDVSSLTQLIYQIYFELKITSFKFLIQIILILTQEPIFILVNLARVIFVFFLKIMLKI
jgi:hypothetical protein